MAMPRMPRGTPSSPGIARSGPAAVDAAEPALRRLARPVAAVYQRDAGLRSLIVALREIGHRNTEENSGALRAAEAVERALHGARGQGARVITGDGPLADRATPNRPPRRVVGIPDPMRGAYLCGGFT
jgi:hypothetical protein